MRVEVNGYKLEFLPRDDQISDFDILREVYEENTYGLQQGDFLSTGIMVDIGANIGAVSLFAVALGAKKVVAYEPEPQNMQCLRAHLAINKITCVETHAEAVWSSRTTISLVEAGGGSNSRPEEVQAHPDKVLMVKTVTLADVLAPYEEIDVLKVDVEGAEYEIFNWDLDTNRKARKIVLEYHRASREQIGGLLAQLVLTHNIQAFGKWNTQGGQILALRY